MSKTTKTATKTATKKVVETDSISKNTLAKYKGLNKIEFGKRKDKRYYNAVAMLRVFSYLCAVKKVDRLTAPDLWEFVEKNSNFDFQKAYHKQLPDSPIHQGLHALSKGKTNEVKTLKDGKTVDTFGRFAQSLYKDDRVGLGHKDGFYYKRPDLNEQGFYKKYEDKAEAIIACKKLVENVPATRK